MRMNFHKKNLYVILALFFFLAISVVADASAKNSTPDSFAELAANQSDVAVNISSTKTVKMRNFLPFPGRDLREFFGDDFFRHFYGKRPQEEMEQKQRSLGSGVIVSKDGYILTNNHVVANAEEIQVILSSQESYKADIIGKDPKTDLALIKIEVDEQIPFAKLGNSDDLRVGDWVVAIGNPFGLGSTVTAGIVSAKGRVIGAGPYDDFIQTDASINPGNSGGPLFNLEGEVVGINTAIVTQSGGNIGIGFTIPINMARSVMNQLKERGKVIRGWLGVTIQPVTPEIKEKFELPDTNGALVAEVVKDSPADKAGVKRGDVILMFDGKKIEEMNDLPPIVAETPVGKEVEVLVIRDGEKKRLKVKVGELEEETRVAGQSLPELEKDFGLSVQELTPEIAESLSLENEEGVIITGVKRGSPASEAGLQRGDLIQEIERTPVEDMDDYRRIIKEASSKKQIIMLVLHRGHTRFVVLKREN